MKKILAVKNLHAAYQIGQREIHAVRGIDFSLHAGEALGIVGESGSGKTTVAKALLKLLPYGTSTLQGEILYKDQNLAAYSERQMQEMRGKEIGMAFQQSLSVLNPTQQVGVQILEGFLRHYKEMGFEEGKRRAFHILKEMGFSTPEPVMNAYPHQLSGGMRQRVVLAIALICQPRILIADEPASSVDVQLKEQILSLLQSMQKDQGKSLILITHDFRVIERCCDRVLVMYAGKIVESGPVQQILHHPQHPYSRKLIEANPSLDHPRNTPLTTIGGAPPQMHLPMSHCSFCSRCPHPMNICAKDAPSLYQVSDQHWSACFKHDPRTPNASRSHSSVTQEDCHHQRRLCDESSKS